VETTPVTARPEWDWKMKFRKTISTVSEQSERERALKMPPRIITRAVLFDRSKYNGAELNRIRASNGVGRPPEVNMLRNWFALRKTPEFFELVSGRSGFEAADVFFSKGRKVA